MTPPADLILRSSREGTAAVITLDPRQPRAEAVAIVGDRIVAVGRSADIDGLRGPHTHVIACDGGALLPGFIDAHAHLSGFAASLRGIDCRDAAITSIADIVAAVRRRAASVEARRWIRGWGYHEFALAEGRHPTRRDLDAATTDHPVRLQHQSGHATVLNSLGLRLVGITIESEDPPGGGIDRDETGEPTGLLYDMESELSRRIGPPPFEELADAVRAASDHYLGVGVTSVQDATASNDVAAIATLARLRRAEGAFVPRLGAMLGADVFLQQRDEAAAVAGPHVRLGAAKLMVTSTLGRLHPPADELAEIVWSVHDADGQLAIHAVEADEVAATLAALEAAQRRRYRHEHRHRIEHCAVAPPSLVRRLEHLRVVVVTQPSFVYHNGDRYLATVPTADQPYLYTLRSFTDNGVPVAASSDAPVVRPNPLESLYAAIGRRSRSGAAVAPTQAVSPLLALWMHTLGGAYAAFEQADKGSIEAGKLADLVLLDTDPLTLPLEGPPERLLEARVELTIVGGDVVWPRS